MFMTGSILGIIVLMLLIFAGVIGVLFFLTRKMELDGENYDQEEMIGYSESIPIIVFNLICKARATIKSGFIVSYNEEKYALWFVGVIVIGSIVNSFLGQGARGAFTQIVLCVFTVLFGFLSCWIYVAWKSVFYRYIAGIKLYYYEGKEVFKIIYLAKCILGILVSIINAVTKGALSIPIYSGLSLVSYQINILYVVVWIWGVVVEYLLLKYRYRLSGKESILKMLLMFLAQIGVIVVIYIIVFIGAMIIALP